LFGAGGAVTVDDVVPVAVTTVTPAATSAGPNTASPTGVSPCRASAAINVAAKALVAALGAAAGLGAGAGGGVGVEAVAALVTVFVTT
jgi:hypothetical protein